MFHKKNTASTRRNIRVRNRNQSFRHPADRLLGAAVFSFLGGIAVILLAMCIFSLLLAHAPVPLTLVRPFACAAAALGVAFSGSLFAKKVGQRFLLCGLVCGLFYAICQLLAAYLLQGNAFLQNGSFLLSVVVLMSGLFGGAFAAARAVR